MIFVNDTCNFFLCKSILCETESLKLIFCHLFFMFFFTFTHLQPNMLHLSLLNPWTSFNFVFFYE